MATQAKITSTDALDTFRASLIVFQTKARRSVNEVSDHVRQTRMWLQHDQRIHWEGECRRLTKALERAEQELTSARLARNNETAVMARQNTVNKMKRSLTEAGDKLRRVKTWHQNYDGRADPLARKLEGLRQFLDIDLPKAAAYLVNVQKILEAYSSASAPEGVNAPAPISTSVEPEGTT